MDIIFLLIDDDADDSELFREALSEVDTDIVLYCAVNGEEALKRLKEIPQPSLLFLDINMPRMNGWECLKRLKASDEYKAIPVIMYSTSSNQREIDIAIDLGALSFITKPHSYSALRNMMRDIVDKIKSNSLNTMQLKASDSN